MAIIDKYLYGWGDFEPVIIGCLAQGHSILLLGNHGSAKTMFGSLVSSALSNGDELKVIKYNMDKENLISMVGIPNTQALKEGRIEYAEHERSVFRADVLMLDEITRAPREAQNMVLEILQEKTVFGKPLKYKFVIATANDETYQGTYKLDAALLDRFYIVIPVPTPKTKHSSMGPEEYAELIKLNLYKRNKNLDKTNKVLSNRVEKTRRTCIELRSNKEVVKSYVNFTSRFFASLMQNIFSGNSDGCDISFRQIGNQFINLLFAVGGYYKSMDDDDFLYRSAQEVIKYSINTKLGIPAKVTDGILESLSHFLTDEEEQMSVFRSNMTLGDINNRIFTIRDNKELYDKLEVVERSTAIGEIINSIVSDDNSAHVKTNMKNLYHAIEHDEHINSKVFLEMAAIHITNSAI